MLVLSSLLVAPTSASAGGKFRYTLTTSGVGESGSYSTNEVYINFLGRRSVSVERSGEGELKAPQLPAGNPHPGVDYPLVQKLIDVANSHIKQG